MNNYILKLKKIKRKYITNYILDWLEVIEIVTIPIKHELLHSKLNEKGTFDF